jgi:hypothetical protein
MHDKLLFDHIPKTGGMSVHRVLQQLLGADQCSPSLPITFSAAYSQFKRFKCVCGHIAFMPGDDVGGCWAFTMLRNPVDRIISLYFYNHNMAHGHGSQFDEACRQLDLEDFVFSEDKIIRDAISNCLIKHFCPLGVNGSRTLPETEQLSVAKKVLEEKYSFIGLADRMDESIDLLCWHLGKPPVGSVPRINVTKDRKPLSQLSARVRQRLEEINQLDMELFEYAVKLYDEKRRAVIVSCVNKKSNQQPQLLDEQTSSDHLESRDQPDSPGIVINFGNHKVEWIECIVSAGVLLGPVLLSGEVALFQLRFRVNADIDDLTIGISIYGEDGSCVFGTNTRQGGYLLSAKQSQIGSAEMRMRIDLAPGKYRIAGSLHPGANHLTECYHWVDRLSEFDVAGNWGAHFEGRYKLYPDWGFQNVGYAESDNARFLRLAKYVEPLVDFSAGLVIRGDVEELSALERAAIEIELTNASQQCWDAFGKKPVRVSYHWLDKQRCIAILDGERTLLPRDLRPGETISMWVKIVAPPSPGEYYLQLTLVQEFVGWFDENGFIPPELMVRVT